MEKRQKNNTILVIEDDISIRTFACELLELEGYRVIQTATGQEGLKLLKKTQIALVLIDLRLPDISGWTVLEQIKSDPGISIIPVIVFTASTDVQKHDFALATGADDYLTKPLSAADLRDAVNRILKFES
jgi:CheY-like chemotaxis protein